MSAASPGRPSLFSLRLDRRRLILLDTVAAVGFGLVAALSLPTALPPASDLPAELFVGLAAAMTVPVAVRRLWPLAGFSLVLTATAASVLLGGYNDWFAAAGFALYIVALNRPAIHRVPTIAIAVITIVAMPCLAMMGTPTPVAPALGPLLVAPVVLGAAWTLGQAIRERREAATDAARRLARQEVAEERLRIARELHDVVAHTMSLIAVKAQVANHVGAKRPEAATEALVDIESAAKGSLTEMRYILGVLRSDHPIQPVPGLTELSSLVERAEHAGVTVTVRSAPVDDLPAGIELAAYRIVQEAVTNVIRHAAPTTCRVDLARESDRLTVTVVDDGPPKHPPVPPHSGGHGLRGMAERVAAYQGTFSAGATASGGYAVHAVLPLTEGGAA